MLARVVKDVLTSFAEDRNTPPLTLFFHRVFCEDTITSRDKACLVSTLLLFHQHVNERLCLVFAPCGLVRMAIPSRAPGTGIEQI